jgi:hypothetical protein
MSLPGPADDDYLYSKSSRLHSCTAYTVHSSDTLLLKANLLLVTSVPVSNPLIPITGRPRLRTSSPHRAISPQIFLR